MLYEIPKEEIAFNHEIYTYLCGDNELALAINVSLVSKSDTVKVKFKLDDWEEDGDKIIIKYFMIKSDDKIAWSIPMMDTVEAVTLFGKKNHYSDLIAAHIACNDNLVVELDMSPGIAALFNANKTSWQQSIESNLSYLQGKINGIIDRINNPSHYPEPNPAKEMHKMSNAVNIL